MSDEARLGEDAVAIAVDASSGSAAIGRVVETGTRAAGLRDKRVLVGPIDPCGECDVCRRGGGAVCPLAVRRGAIGPTVIAAARWVVALEDGLELPLPGAAAVAGDAAVAYTLYARTNLAPKEPAVVVGASPVARFLVEILLAKEIVPTVVADPTRTAWCAWLGERGASIARVSSDANDGDARAAVADAMAAHGLPTRPWRVLAATADAVPRAAALAGPRATLTVLAPLAQLPGELAAREVAIVTVAGAHPDLVVEVAAMCTKGQIDLVHGTRTEPGDPTKTLVVPLATASARS